MARPSSPSSMHTQARSVPLCQAEFVQRGRPHAVDEAADVAGGRDRGQSGNRRLIRIEAAA